MKKYIVCIFMCITMCFVAGGCSRQVDIDAEEAIQGQEGTEETEQDTGTDTPEEVVEETEQSTEEGNGEYHFVLPENWSVCGKKRSDDSAIELQGVTDDLYAAVIVLDETLIDGKNITTYVDRYAEEARNTYEDVTVEDAKLFFVDDHKAYKLSVQGTLEDRDYINYMYAVDAGEYWYITTACAYLAQKDVLEQDMDGFVPTFYKVEGDEPVAE